VGERGERWQARFEIVVLVAALLVIPVIVVEQSYAGEPWRTAAAVANWAIWFIFVTEVVVMTSVVQNRRVWLRQHLLDLAIIVLTPPFMPSSLQAFRAFRLLRLLRLLRAIRATRKVFTVNGLQYIAILAALTLFGGGAAFAAAEGRDVSTWDGVWWAMTTMTTVGYGDISPQTHLGRAIAVVVMLVGIGFIAVLTAALAQRFVAEEVREEVEKAEEEIGDEFAEAEADVLTEIREIGVRLRRVEERLAQRPGQ